MSVLISAMGVSNGLVLGRARVLDDAPLEILEYSLPLERTTEEVRRFRGAVRAARQELHTAREQIPEGTPGEIGAFIDTHLQMLDDRTFTGSVEVRIRRQACNAEWALKVQRDRIAEVFVNMPDEYLRERLADVDHVVNRIQRHLLAGAQPSAATRVAGRQIVVAGDVSPADLIILHSQGARGLITESGGPLSHTSILARSLGIPALVGLRRGRRLFREEEEVALDGTAGTAVIAPEPRELRFLRRRQRERSRQAERTRGLARRLPRTRDGTRITLRANIELPGDLRQVNQHGIQGIGLYRTEFLYMNRAEQPPENEQLRAYLRCLRAAAGQPVTIRTADLDPGAGLGTRNPALGMRGIRRSLNEPTEFLVQLRALLRAAAQGTLEIMLPMVSAASEIRRTRRLLQVAHESLSAEGVGHGWPIRLGAMIETPAAALQAGAIAAEADFLSLGTNDLIQYTLAIDRNEEAVNYLYNPLHPAVLRLIDETVKAGRRAGIRVAICGEMAADTRYTALLAGLGLREFSVRPAVLQEVRGRIHEIDIERVARSARRLLSARSVNDSEQRLQQLNRRADSQSGH